MKIIKTINEFKTCVQVIRKEIEEKNLPMKCVLVSVDPSCLFELLKDYESDAEMLEDFKIVQPIFQQDLGRHDDDYAAEIFFKDIWGWKITQSVCLGVPMDIDTNNMWLYDTQHRLIYIKKFMDGAPIDLENFVTAFSDIVPSVPAAKSCPLYEEFCRLANGCQKSKKIYYASLKKYDCTMMISQLMEPITVEIDVAPALVIIDKYCGKNEQKYGHNDWHKRRFRLSSHLPAFKFLFRTPSKKVFQHFYDDNDIFKKKCKRRFTELCSDAQNEKSDEGKTEDFICTLLTSAIDDAGRIDFNTELTPSLYAILHSTTPLNKVYLSAFQRLSNALDTCTELYDASPKFFNDLKIILKTMHASQITLKSISMSIKKYADDMKDKSQTDKAFTGYISTNITGMSLSNSDAAIVFLRAILSFREKYNLIDVSQIFIRELQNGYLSHIQNNCSKLCDPRIAKKDRNGRFQVIREFCNAICKTVDRELK